MVKLLFLLFRSFVLLCLLLWSAGALASPGSVVFKSFKDRSLALKESAQISRQFGIEARIEEARVNGMLYHRVLGPPMDQASVRELIGQARSSGLGDVWVLSLRERPVVRIKDRAPEQDNWLRNRQQNCQRGRLKSLAMNYRSSELG